MAGVVLQNDTEDGPSLLGDWFDDQGIPFETVRTWEEGVPPDPEAYDFVVAMGSKHSATDQEPAWVQEEVDFLRRSVEADVPVLGICFGGQALARALGAEISAADELSVGWFETTTHDPSVVPSGPFLHLNFEQFALPDGATLVAESPIGNDAFTLGPHMGLQFHPEATPRQVGIWLDDEDLAKPLAEREVDSEAIREQGRVLGDTAAQQARELFGAWYSRATATAETPTERL